MKALKIKTDLNVTGPIEDVLLECVVRVIKQAQKSATSASGS